MPPVVDGVRLQRHPGRLVAWIGFVVALASLAYAGSAASGDSGAGSDDVAYRYESSILVLVQFALMLGVLLLIGRGLPLRELFALRRPRSWGRALGLTVLALLAIWAISGVYSLVISRFGDWDPQEEQGLVPDEWDPSRAGAFIAFLLSVTILAPAVEELTFRGMGISLLRPYGAGVAIVVSGILFGLVHGLLVAFPVLAAFGFVVGWLRLRTDSVYPPMLLHATFNGVALIAAVTVA